MTAGAAQPSIVRFRNVADAAGLRFVRGNSTNPGKYFVDSAPGGVAVFDYNGDGRPDIFLTNGAKTPSLEKTFPTDANRLFRNDGNMKFTDVTDTAGVRGVGYAMVRPRPTTTTTATWISSSQVSDRTSCCATEGTGRLRT